MRVTNTMMVNNMLASLQTNMRYLEKYQLQLATERKINRPSDDPAGIVKSLRFRTNIVEGEQYRRNINDAKGYLETVDAALYKIDEQIINIRTLTVQGATGTNSQDSFQAIADEIRQINEHIKTLANATYGSKYVFGGTNVTESPCAPDGSWRGNSYVINVEIGVGIVVPLSLDMKDFFMGWTDVISNNNSVLAGVTATGLQEARYTIDTELLNSATAVDANIIQVEAYNEQIRSQSVLGQAVAAIQNTNSDVNASIELTVKDVDLKTGTVTYAYLAHEYAADGTYTRIPALGDPEATFTLQYGLYDSTGTLTYLPSTSPAAQVVQIGSSQITISDFNIDVGLIDDVDLNAFTNYTEAELRDELAKESYNMNYQLTALTAGDKGIYNITAAMGANTDYQSITVGGQQFVFDAGVLDNQDFVLNINQVNQSTGLSYEGSLNLSFAAFGDSQVVVDYNYGIFDFVENLARTIEIGKLPDVGNLLEDTDVRMKNLLLNISLVGARVNRLDLQDSRLRDADTTLNELLGQTEDVNVEQVIMLLEIQETVYRATLAAGARIIQPTLTDFLS